MVSTNEAAEANAVTEPHTKEVNARDFVLYKLKIVEDQLDNLNREKPEIEKFEKINIEYESLLKKYKQRNTAILSNLNKNCISPTADLVVRDQEVFRGNVLRLDNAFSVYSGFANDAEKDGTSEHKSPHIEEVLKILGTIGSKAPNVTQPSFTPKNNSGDFTSFREFLLHF